MEEVDHHQEAAILLQEAAILVQVALMQQQNMLHQHTSQYMYQLQPVAALHHMETPTGLGILLVHMDTDIVLIHHMYLYQEMIIIHLLQEII